MNLIYLFYEFLKILLILLIIGGYLKLIEVIFLILQKRISKKSRNIKDKELKKSLNFWIKELLIEPNKKIDIKLINPEDDDFKTAKKNGGAFVDKVKDTYKIRIINQLEYAREAVLVHELLHIKLNHADKEKKYFGRIFFVKWCFEIKANKELIKYKNLLISRA